MLTFYFRVIFTVIAFCVTYLSYLTMHNSRTNSTVPARLARLTFKINEYQEHFTAPNSFRLCTTKSRFRAIICSHVREITIFPLGRTEPTNYFSHCSE